MADFREEPQLGAAIGRRTVSASARLFLGSPVLSSVPLISKAGG